jgi:ribonuclease P protein component
VRVSGRHIQVFLLADSPDSPSRPRLGISVPRQVGTSVQRNRVRRRLREIFRRTRSLFSNAAPRATRLVVNARPSSAGAAFSELLEDYESAVTRALRALDRSRPPRR